MKIIRSLENRGILLKRTTTKIISQEGEFLNFLGPFIKTGLTLMKKYIGLIIFCLFIYFILF